MADWPPLSVVVETSTWKVNGHIQLRDTLQALKQQTYPASRLEIIVVIPPEHRQRWEQMVSDMPGVAVVDAPPGRSYYQLKMRGLARARGDIVAFLDADTWIVPDWVREMARPLIEDNRVGAVHGRHRFRISFLSRMWDAVWWPRAYRPEGPIDRLSGANNVAFRRAFLEQHFYDDPNPHRGVWERVMTARIRGSGRLIWLNPQALFIHDYHPSLAHFARLALARGYHLLASRLQSPRAGERFLTVVPWFAPWIIFPGLVVKDAWRILSLTPRLGLRRWELWKVPFYALAYLLIEPVVLAGMVLAAAARPAPRLP